MVDGTTGSPGAVTSPAPPNGTYSMGLETSGDRFDFDVDNDVLVPGTIQQQNIKVSFKVQFVDATPVSGDTDFFDIRTGGGTTDDYHHLTLRLKAVSGNVEIRSAGNTTVDATITNPFTDNTWSQVSVWMERSVGGDAEVVIDGASTTTSGRDYQSANGNTLHAEWKRNGGTNFYVSEVCIHTGATGDTNSQLPNAVDVFGYRPGGIGDGTTKTDADALDSGFWRNTGTQPLDTGFAQYTNTPRSGAVDFDYSASDGAGPASATSTPTGTYIGGSYWWHAYRGNGGGTTHTLYYGSDGDTTMGAMSSVTASVGTSASPHWATEDDTAIIPTSSEDASAGIGVSGDRDISAEMQVFMLAVDADPASSFQPAWASQANSFLNHSVSTG